MAGELERDIKKRGKQLLVTIGSKKPPMFQGLSGRILERCMRNVSFKTKILRFIEKLPLLPTPETTIQYLNHHFREQKIQNLPWPVRLFLWAIRYNNKLITIMADKFIRAETEKVASVFLINNDSKTAAKTIEKLRKRGFACTIDIIGESLTDESKARDYRRLYYLLLAQLETDEPWKTLGDSGSNMDWGYAPKINIALKPSSLCSTPDPNNFEKSVESLCRSIEPILLKAVEIGAFVWIDMEQYRFKDITIEAYRRLRSNLTFHHWPHFGIAIQSYLRDTDRDLANLLEWAREKNLPIAIRLVKGAYWDHEVEVARQGNIEPPVYTRKAETDAAFERHTKKILENHDICFYAGASHNIRSIAFGLATKKELHVPEDRAENQVLYGIGELVGTAILKTGGHVRFYCPLGKPLDGTAYLVRRILENTANESIIRQIFVEKADADRLLENPLEILKDN
ncbi:proline dehydrogenase family protein [Candidatus Falkowbacteria bacterium]|nr:proline dehydrogenase family protein [Candidatus Falkowbacteria bacterium]